MKTQTIQTVLLLICINLMLFSCQDISTHNESPYEGPPKDHIISVDRAQEMYDAYSQRRVPILQKYEDSIAADGSKFTPTRYAEYDLKTIKQYIAYIEHEAKEANVEIQTLRFYLSNYPASDKFPNGDVVKFPKRNSFFVVPTMAYEGKNVGFYLEDIDGVYTALPINRNGLRGKDENKMRDEPQGNVNEAGFFISAAPTLQGGGTTSIIFNEGNITPPPAGANDFGDDN
ncbi:MULTISPECIES: hypothetical protein [Aequorivita]|uniref:Uncharacterized protein n=1 Tax=Aequorivita iocasae TaxID=2803865 RepID=A0ABX7DRG0_9FLAO|nr:MULTISPECIES: hypothetical protein [Aequorivita]QQX76731.1 hypothetical protein JK629_00200 [Aequorivita iocasae]UCA56203.1 hypothetical protein LDL78_00200 [Aequorivita sp. F7]